MGFSLDWSLFLQELPEGGAYYWEMLLSGLWWIEVWEIGSGEFELRPSGRPGAMAYRIQ